MIVPVLMAQHSIQGAGLCFQAFEIGRLGTLGGSSHQADHGTRICFGFASLVFFISIFSSRAMVMRPHKGGGAQRGLDEYIEDGLIEYSIYIPLI